MGLLDDAIREHLDLKRRRGADPDEVERLEREALGPVRRPQADPFDSPSAGESSHPSGSQDDEPAQAWSDDPAERSFTDHSAALADEEEEFEDWDALKRPPVQRDRRDPVDGGIGAEPGLPARGAPPPSPAEERPGAGSIDEQDYLDQETVEHDVEGEELAHSEEDDMLEETPDFLQDTPDHDRLWFEQRPPRDFDLDG